MQEKCLSIITNFGCHYTCPYCIVRENGLSIPKTTLAGLDILKNTYLSGGYNIISISGGGDPMFHFNEHIDWYNKLFEIANELHAPLELHTSYIDLPAELDVSKFYRIVYHSHEHKYYKNDLNRIKKFGNEIVRAVFVVEKDFTEDDINYIADFCSKSTAIDELSFRQMVDSNYQNTYYNYDYLTAGHKKRWFYITQYDYNTYYTEGNTNNKFANFKQ